MQNRLTIKDIARLAAWEIYGFPVLNNESGGASARASVLKQ